LMLKRKDEQRVLFEKKESNHIQYVIKFDTRKRQTDFKIRQK